MKHVYMVHISMESGDFKMKNCIKNKKQDPDIYKSGGYYGTISPKDF